MPSFPVRENCLGLFSAGRMRMVLLHRLSRGFWRRVGNPSSISRHYTVQTVLPLLVVRFRKQSSRLHPRRFVLFGKESWDPTSAQFPVVKSIRERFVRSINTWKLLEKFVSHQRPPDRFNSHTLLEIFAPIWRFVTSGPYVWTSRRWISVAITLSWARKRVVFSHFILGGRGAGSARRFFRREKLSQTEISTY